MTKPSFMPILESFGPMYIGIQPEIRASNIFSVRKLLEFSIISTYFESEYSSCLLSISGIFALMGF